MPCRIFDVTGSRKQPVLAASGLDPLQIDQLAGKELRSRLLDLEILVDGKHAKRSHRFVASGMNSHWQIMKIVNRLATRAQKRTHVIRQPESTEDVHERLAGAPRDV